MFYRVRELRLNKNMSQYELAAKSNLSRRTIIKIENGETLNVSIKTLISIAHALDVSVNDLYEVKQ